MNRIRFRNKILQALYRPRRSNSIFMMPSATFSALDDLEKSIEEKITPLLSDFFL
jgi:hypothetical protein